MNMILNMYLEFEQTHALEIFPQGFCLALGREVAYAVSFPSETYLI